MMIGLKYLNQEQIKNKKDFRDGSRLLKKIVFKYGLLEDYAQSICWSKRLNKILSSECASKEFYIAWYEKLYYITVDDIRMVNFLKSKKPSDIFFGRGTCAFWFHKTSEGHEKEFWFNISAKLEHDKELNKKFKESKRIWENK